MRKTKPQDSFRWEGNTAVIGGALAQEIHAGAKRLGMKPEALLNKCIGEFLDRNQPDGNGGAR